MGWLVPAVGGLLTTGVQGLSGGKEFTQILDMALHTLNPELKNTTTRDIAASGYNVEHAQESRAQSTSSSGRATSIDVGRIG
jgi:hypothetical protein